MEASKNHAKQIEEEANTFLGYLRLCGRDRESRKFIEKTKDAEGHYHTALKYFGDYMEQAEQRMKELERERRQPGYIPTGRLMEEALSFLEGMCMCTHCRLIRKGYFEDPLDSDSWVREYDVWVRNKNLGPLRTIEAYDPDWDD